MAFKQISLAFRFIFKRLGFASINIVGLALGISSCLFITSYVKHHKSFDKQAPFPERTYRVTYQRWTENGDRVEFASASPTIGPSIKQIIPEAESFGRAFKVGGVFAHNEHTYEEEMAFYGETNLIDILGFNLTQGQKMGCLDQPNQVVLSQKVAHKFFGDQNPIGQTLKWNGRTNLEVTGVYTDLPSNVHFKPDLFVSMATWIQRTPQLFEGGWYNSGFYTYVVLEEGTNPKMVDKKIEEFIEKEFGETLREYKTGLSFKLQPLLDIHLNSHFMHELELNSDKSSIILLQIIAWFILLVAWVNFFNLSTISSLKRIKEIGIRKVNGANRLQLTLQLLLESALINIIAILLAFTFFEIGYSVFANIAGLPTTSNYLTQEWFYTILGLAFVIGTISAGIYSISSIGADTLVASLKGIIVGTKNNIILKKSLVTFQFSIAIALLAGTIGVYRQFSYMQSQSLGFTLDNLLVVKVPMVGDSTLQSRFWVFEELANQLSSVGGVAYSSIIPGKPNMFNRGGIHRYGDDPNNGKNMRLTEIDANFVKVFGIQLIAGNGFTGNPTEDANNVMLNLKGAEWLNFKNAEEAIGSQIVLEGRPKTVVGILFDFNQLSPKEEIEPQIFRFPERYQGYFTVRLNSDPNSDLIEKVKSIYTSVFPGNPFDYFFLDQFYGDQYKHDKRFGMVFLLFSLLSVFVTVLGLMSLSAYSAEQRKREIGIRKVLGASPQSILQLLFRDYLLLWIIASSIAIPVVWHFLNEWLNGYAKRIDVSVSIFITPLLVVLAVSIVTVLSQSIKAANMNPVESIKQE